MKVHSITERLAQLPFFAGMPEDHLDFISACAQNFHFRQGEFLMLAGKPTKGFFVIREGSVVLELESANRIFTIQTVGESELVGWSWLVPPYKGHYDARAVTPVSAIGFGADCVRRKCETDPVFGYQMFKRFSRLIVERLLATRMQLADLYL